MELHPNNTATIANTRAVVHKNGGTLYPRPLIEFTDAILGLRGYSKARASRSRLWPSVARQAATVSTSVGRYGALGYSPDYDERDPW